MAENEKLNNVAVDNDVGTMEDVDAIMKKYDRESNTRVWEGTPRKILRVLTALFGIFLIVMNMWIKMDERARRPLFLGLVIILVFIYYPIKKGSQKVNYMPWYDIVMAAVGAFCFFFYPLNLEKIVSAGTRIQKAFVVQIGSISIPLLIVFAIIGTLILVECCRRVVGMPIICVATVFVLYAFLGAGKDLKTVMYNLFYTTTGILGTPIGVCSTYIALFVIFGAFLEATGVANFFIDCANALVGWASGGPAKVAVVSSALCGMVSGSSVGNTVTTGSVTIPMMKKLGYHKNFAGAVEAAASTGGQLMPPIMGAAAFLMAEFVGIPYMEVVKAAIVPAILYFIGVFLGVHFEAKKNNLQGTPRSELPPWGKILKEEGHLAIPLIAIIGLLASGYTPMKAALAGIFISIASAMLRANTRMSIADIIDGLIKGARGALGVLIACSSAGMIIGIVTKTGVGLKLASALVDIAAGNFILLLFCTMITSLILGMGVPTTANYVITSTIAAPALISLGVPILAAHMFVFYFGIIADITPPVALAAFAGSAISGGDPLKTGVNASKLGIAAFIIPYVFVLSPEILGINATLFSVMETTITALIGMVGVSGAMIGQLYCKANILERLLLLAGGLCLIDPTILTDIIGIAVLGGVFAMQYFRSKKSK